MPKDPSKNIDRYKIRGGTLNEFEYAENQEALAEDKTQKGTQLIPGTPPEQRQLPQIATKKVAAKKGATKSTKKSAKKTAKSAKKSTKTTKKAAKSTKKSAKSSKAKPVATRGASAKKLAARKAAKKK